MQGPPAILGGVSSVVLDDRSAIKPDTFSVHVAEGGASSVAFETAIPKDILSFRKFLVSD